MKAIKEQIDEQPKIIKLFSINYARDLLYINTCTSPFVKAMYQFTTSCISETVVWYIVTAGLSWMIYVSIKR